MKIQIIAWFLVGLLLATPAVVRAQFNHTITNGTITITGYTGTNDDVTIPSTIDGLPVTDIGTNAFYGSRITSVRFGGSLVSIGAYAFSGAFEAQPISKPAQGCPLTSITIPDSVRSIGDHAFYYCSLTNVLLGSGLTSIGDQAFVGCPLVAIDVAAGNPAFSSVGGVLFNRNQTTLIEYPGGLDGSYTIPDTVTNIEYRAFNACTGLTNVVLDSGLVNIGAYAFSGDAFGPLGVRFQLGCPLTSIVVPASVASIGEYAFCNCSFLTSLYFLGDAPSADSTIFSSYGWFSPPADPTTAYYLPGTSGWAEFAANTGIPTALWMLPYPLVLAGNVGVQSNQFTFTVSWATNLSVVIEASTDLTSKNWTPIQTNALNNGVVNFTDPQWTNYPSRFYRVRSQ